jgi:prepilin signal peptidase PulO-like enzyme (type II secretory pathway)
VAESVILGILGLFLGRFLNLTIDRLPPQPTSPPGDSPQQSNPAGSHPPFLATLIPLAGTFWQCSSAGPRTRMPFRYPVVEVLTAGLCAFIGYRYGLTLPATVLIVYCALLSTLLSSTWSIP